MSSVKKRLQSFTFAILLMSGFVTTRSVADDTTPVNYPFNEYYNDKNVVQHDKDVHGTMVEQFDWQEEWGSIHMNTFTDGLRDPGEPGSTPDSIVPCSQGVICNDPQVTGPVGTMPPTEVNADIVFNGVKYDFKNSFLNCASRPSPNFPSGNGGWNHPFSKFVCSEADPTIPAPDYTTADGERWGKPTIIYSPLYDPRSNDERANGKDRAGAGCIQQIANSCINDIHECASFPETGDTDFDGKAPYWYPTSHVFTPNEVKQLEATGMVGKILPEKYYEYTTSGGSKALSATLDNYPDQKSGDRAKEINTYNDKLAKIKTYRLENLGSIDSDVTGFLIADPSNFFNLRHYMKGGSMASGFAAHGMVGQNPDPNSSMISNGNPVTYDTCPIIGIGGYGGICDPKGFNDPQWAGCNLPIYGIGPEANITHGGKTYKDRHNPVIWSGYVKKWAFIDKLQYLQNIKKRRGANGGILYAGQTDHHTEDAFMADDEHPFVSLNGFYVDPYTADLEDSPILMVERAPEYCDKDRELFKERAKPGESPEIPCIHYFQYQELDLLDNSTKWTFVNLFQPKYDGDFGTQYGYAYLDLYHQIEYYKEQPDGTKKKVKEPFIEDKFDYFGNGNKQLLPIVCNDGFDAAEHGTCADNGTINDKDYLDEEILEAMGFDYGFDPNKNYVTFMDAKVPYLKLYRYDENDELVEDEGIENPEVLERTVVERSKYCDSLDSEADCTGKIYAPLNTKGENSIGHYLEKNEEGNPIVTSGTHLKLPAGKVLALRMPEPKEARESRLALASVSENGRESISTRCAIAMNKSLNVDSSNYFVPTNTQSEINSFVNAESTDIEFRPCKAEYLTYEKSKQAKSTPPTEEGLNPANKTKTWFGQVKCSQLTQQPTCNNTKIITAQRYCILEDGEFGNCKECMDAQNAAIDDGRILASRAGDGKDDLLSLPGEMNDEIGGIVLSVASADDSNGACYFSALCVVQDAAGCPSAATSGGHVFCLSPDTKIDMADGTKKEIADIKDGEKVMAFTAKGSKSELIKAKVVATTVTRDQDYMIVEIRSNIGKYTTLNITPEHKMILPIGRSVMVKDLKVGVPILDADGNRQVITSIEKAKKRIDVHNLILEDGAEGYIAEGIRVQSYGLSSELKQMMSLNK